MKEKFYQTLATFYLRGVKVTQFISSIVFKEGKVGVILESTKLKQYHGIILQDLEYIIEFAIKSINSDLEVLIVRYGQKGLDSEIISPKQESLTSKTRVRIPYIKNILSIVSCKGGVGKSSTVVNLANVLFRKGFKVGILDADIYGPSIPTMLGLDSKPIVEGEKIIPLVRRGIKSISIGYIIDKEVAAIWRGPILTKSIKKLFSGTDWGELDYLLIDTPPGTGDVHLSITENFITDGAILVTTPQNLAVEESKRMINMLRKLNIHLYGIIENMSYFQVGEYKRYIFGYGGGKKLADVYNVPLLGEVRLNEYIREKLDEGKFDDLDDQTLEDYYGIADKVCEILNSKTEF